MELAWAAAARLCLKPNIYEAALGLANGYGWSMGLRVGWSDDNFHACPSKLRMSRGSLGSLLVINPSAWRQMEAALPLTHGFWLGFLVGFEFGFEFWTWSPAAAAALLRLRCLLK